MKVCRLTLSALVLLTLTLFASRALQAATFALGTTTRLEGAGQGIDSVVLAASPATAAWTASTNATWLHLSAGNQSGMGSTNVVFRYDVNPGITRTGTLTIAGLTLAVTQAGFTYVAAPGPLTTLVSSGLGGPEGIAVDGLGNVYVADSSDNAIKEWTVVSNTVNTLVSSNLSNPRGLAVGGSGDVYIADSGDNAIKVWSPAGNTLTTLVPSTAGLSDPSAVALDAGGNVYIADYNNNAIKEWTASSGALTTLVASGLSGPSSLAVDRAGNVYFLDQGSNYSNPSIQEWTAANNRVATLVSSRSINPISVAVDGAGNVYMADYFNIAVSEWTAANQTVTTLASSVLNGPSSVAVDASGDVYIADFYGDTITEAIDELPHAFVDPTPNMESGPAGADVLPVVLPATVNLTAPFAPASDSPWLAISSASNGLVQFNFGENTTGSNRTAKITLLGQPIPVNQTFLAPPAPVWPAPAPITYGTALTSNQLNASVTEPGTLSYNPPAGTILPAGTNTLSTVFKPNDTNQYSGGTFAVILVVLPEPLIATANNATRAYGAANPMFMGTISGLISNDNITATYSCSATTDSPAGAYPIVPALIDPNGRLVNYNAVLVNGALTVTSPVPVITSPPQSQSVSCGSTVAFNVGVSGPSPYYYQWWRNQSIVPGYEVPVCCQGMLILSNVDTTYSGLYSVVVSNNYGSVTSAPAQLSVVDPTRYPLSIGLQGSNAVLSWPATCANYVLQSAPNLGPPATWTTTPTPSVATTGDNQVTIPLQTSTVFYRLQASESADADFTGDSTGLGVNWTNNGPGLCGRLVGIVASPTNPNTLMVSSAGGGVWRSTNGGASWAMPGDYALGDFTVVHLEWDRIRSGRLFASTYSDLYATTDLGDYWSDLTHFGGYPAPLMPPDHPTVPEPFAQLRYSDTQSTVFWSKPCLGLYYSYDGSTFTQSWPFPGGSTNPDNCILAIGADDATGYVYFSTMVSDPFGPPHLFRSAVPWTTTTPCLSWVSVNAGLPDQSYVCSIAYGGSANTMAVLVDPGSGQPEVYTTTNATSWNPTPTQPPGPIWDPRALIWPAPKQFLLSADVAQQTVDGGHTWSQTWFSPMHPDVRAYYWANNPNEPYLWMTTDGSEDSGVYVTIARWNFTPGFAPTGGTAVGLNGLSTWQCYFMEATGNSGGSRRRIFLGAQDNGCLASDNNGTTWTTAGTPSGGGCGDFFSMAIAPSNPDRAYSRTCASGFDRSDNAFSAPTCAAVSWTHMSSGGVNAYPFNIVDEGMTAVDPTNADHVCFAGFNNLGVSKDGGMTWTTHTLPGGAQPGCVYYDGSANLYAGTGGNGAYVSADDGMTWTQFGLNSPAPAAVMRIAHSSAGGGAGTFFLATTSGLYRKLPGGSYTLRTIDPAYAVSDVEIDPNNPMRVCISMGYAGNDNQQRGGVLLSTNNGTTFTSLTSGMSIHQAPIAAVQFDPVDSRMIHTAVYGLGGWTYVGP